MLFNKYGERDNSTSKEPMKRLAQAYVPFQVLGDVFNPMEALCKGTLFPNLWMPYKPSK